jgi:hypothetical protein
MLEKIEYGGWKNCLKLSNENIELVVTTDVGPRIIRLGFVGAQNLFKEFKNQLGRKKDDHWLCYGGHRLWHAPEDPERTYWPDNAPVEHEWKNETLLLQAPVEASSGIRKEMEIRMDKKDASVRVTHRLVNLGLWPVETAAWCLSVMAQGGVAVVPQEPFKPHSDALLPARPMVLWYYTDMEDPRWKWASQWIELHQDPSDGKQQKVGILNKQGWAAYRLGHHLFVKKFNYVENAQYPDYGCNTELYTDADILEVESLSPMQSLSPKGGSLEYVETWHLGKTRTPAEEDWVKKDLLPLVMQTGR